MSFEHFEKDRMIALHAFEDPMAQQRAVVPPVYFNSLHVFPDMAAYLHCDPEKEFIYGRVSNPTVHLLEEKLAALEQGSMALVFSSGMAALTTAMHTCLKAGDHMVCVDNSYGPTMNFIKEVCVPLLSMTADFVKADADAVIAAIKPNTRMILLESPTSLVFEVMDIRAVTRVAREKGIFTYIDNTYCTPLYQKPLTLGVDIVMHTLSKYLGGHSDVIGGALAVSDPALGKRLQHMREFYGGVIGPMEGWLTLRGLRTLAVRLPAHEQVADQVAAFLEAHPQVQKVHYPGLASHAQHQLAKQQQAGNCGLMSFEIKGDKEKARAVCDRLKIFQIGVSWGGFESLVVMPMYKKTEEEARGCGTSNNLIRIHCGLEGVDHLIQDLDQALSILK